MGRESRCGRDRLRPGREDREADSSATLSALAAMIASPASSRRVARAGIQIVGRVDREDRRAAERRDDAGRRRECQGERRAYEKSPRYVSTLLRATAAAGASSIQPTAPHCHDPKFDSREADRGERSPPGLRRGPRTRNSGSVAMRTVPKGTLLAPYVPRLLHAWSDDPASAGAPSRGRSSRSTSPASRRWRSASRQRPRAPRSSSTTISAVFAEPDRRRRAPRRRRAEFRGDALLLFFAGDRHAERAVRRRVGHAVDDRRGRARR